MIVFVFVFVTNLIAREQRAYKFQKVDACDLQFVVFERPVELKFLVKEGMDIFYLLFTKISSNFILLAADHPSLLHRKKQLRGNIRRNFHQLYVFFQPG